MFCLSDIFEGELCGFVKNLVLMMYVMMDDEEELFCCLVYAFGVESFTWLNVGEMYLLFGVYVLMNGFLFGVYV